jgi:purine-nucleoside phosphorylase
MANDVNIKDLVPTPHNEAKMGDFAKTVLMPGDPLRAKFIAENFLTNAKLVNNVRGIQGYTGTYKGVPVSVMASGMGMPSIAIYSYELYKFYGVENIIRVGSAGGLTDDVKLRDIVFGMGACANSSFAKQYNLLGDFSPIADFSLLKIGVDIAKENNLNFHVGNILSSDAFYGENPDEMKKWKDMGVLAVEMEAAALYMNAANLGKRALAVCTISDHLFTGKSLPSSERQTSFTDMMKVALEIAVKMEN